MQLSLGLVLGSMILSTASVALAQEKVSLCTGLSARQNIFRHVEAALEKQGIKVIYPIDPVLAGGADSIKGLLDGQCDAAASGGDFESLMQMSLEARLNVDRTKLTYRVIGRDLIKVVTHPKLEIGQVSMKQLADILSGQAKSWKDVGGPDLPIKLVIATKKPVTRTNVKSQVLKKLDFRLDAIPVENWDEAVTYLQKNPGSLCFMAGNTDAKDLRVLKTEEELGRPITLLTVGKPTEKVLKVVKFIQNEGSKLIPR